MKTKTFEKHDFSAQFTTEPVACENLLREGTGREKIHFVGNVMIDSLQHNTLRENTERPVTVVQDTNTIVGHAQGQSLAVVDDVLNHGGKRVRLPELWGGKAAGRIKQILNDWLQQHRAPMVATG